MNAAETNPLIRKLGRFSSLHPEEARILQSVWSRIVPIGPHQEIVREGDSPADCHLLLEGMACRFKVLPDGRRQIFSFHVAGDILDAQSFLIEEMDHSVAAINACKLALIPHARLRQLLQEFPRLAALIWKDTLVDAAIFREWTASIGRRSAYERIAHLMCELITKLGAVGFSRDHSMAWPLTQQEVSDALGLSAVHVNRTLQELRANGLLTLRGGSLVIHNWEELVRIAKFSPRYLHLSEPSSVGGKPGEQDKVTSQISTSPAKCKLRIT